jgi:crossover junction endodeoxyribonuclease RuvC
MKYIIGVDPGISGALALLEEGTWKMADLVDMPVMPGTGTRQQVDGAQLATILRLWNQEGLVKCCYLERAASMPDQSVVSMFSFGEGYGKVKGVLECLGIPYTLVTPQQWKKACGLIKQPKDKSRKIAQQLYQYAELDKKKYCGRADAILIARFGG